MHIENYGGFVIVRPLETSDVDDVVERVRTRLAHDAQRNPLLSAHFSTSHFASAINDARDQVWIALDNEKVVGHLYGALLTSDDYGHGAWLGPDGVSFDTVDVLAALYSEAGASWVTAGALEHYAWVFDDVDDLAPWYELGFSRMHQRGVLALGERRRHQLSAGYQLRRGGADDLALAVELDHVLDEAQRRGPSFAIVEHGPRPEELFEALSDDEVRHYVVEFEGRGVAQCLTFPLGARRGSFDKTLHVSAVSVLPDHEHRGIATALIDHALNNALGAGFEYVETNWRVTNRRAARFWTRYGFSPTYVRLHRTIGSS